MTINISKFESEFLEIIREFLGNISSVDRFCSEFTDLWIKFRDKQSKIRETWSEPLDNQLIEARLQGKLSPEEFEKQFSALYGLDEIKEFCKMVDSIHSSCSAYYPIPENKWEIDEEKLRTEVNSSLVMYLNK
jgi:hypothetical protein